MTPEVMETQRLLLRQFMPADASIILRLLNEPSFVENVGDRHIRTIDEATAYLAAGPIASYEEHGHGLYLVILKSTGEPIGMCGLLKRTQFADADVGYALFPEFWRRGFAEESVSAVIDYGRRKLGMNRIIAIVAPHNSPSTMLLQKLGFIFEERTLIEPSGSEVLVYASSSIVTPPSS